jgi:hypothetical protein
MKRRWPKGKFMKKVSKPGGNGLRSEYRRSDFGVLVRGKYVERLRKSSKVVALDPRVADISPNLAAVNTAVLPLERPPSDRPVIGQFDPTIQPILPTTRRDR